MDRRIAIFAVLLVATPAAAQPNLGTLDIPANRVCFDRNGDGTCDDFWWKPWGTPDTSGWQKININCGSDNNCSPAEVQTALDTANGSGQIFIIPAGTHSWGSGSRVSWTTNNTVLRCAGKAVKNSPDTTLSVPGTSPTSVRIGNYSEGAGIGWTGGYTRGTTAVTVADASSFRVGDWVVLRSSGSGNVCTALWDNPVGGSPVNVPDQTGHRTKITAISGNTITLETPLRYDHSQCGGSKIIAKISATMNSGLENCHFLGDGGNGNEYAGFFFMEGIGNWATGNKFENADAQMAIIDRGARAVWRGNWIKNSNPDGFDNQCAFCLQGQSDAVVENNIFENSDEPINVKSGTDGAVLAYNYWRGPWQNKGIFLHGSFPREILVEGNDAQQPFTTDSYWGRNGPSVLYRNRFRDNRSGNPSQPGRLGVQTLAFGTTAPTSTQLTVIANFANWFFHMNGLCTDASYANCPPSWVFDRQTQKVHLEKNVCFGEEDGSPTNDCIRLGPVTNHNVVNSDTSCGNGGTGAGDCPYSASNQTLGDNQMGARVKPSSWANDVIPVSLYRAAAPGWWCQEACPWSQAGIGALGDDARNGFGSLCKLPAQIAYEGGTCTPVGGTPPPQRLDPPVIQ